MMKCQQQGPSHWCILEYCWKLTSDAHTNKNTVVILVLMATDLLSCQVVQVGQLLLMDLEVPENKQGNKRRRILLKDNKTSCINKWVSADMNFDESAACLTKSLVMSAKRTITQRAYWHLGDIQPQDSPEELSQNPKLDEALPEMIHTVLPETLSSNYLGVNCKQSNPFLIICIGKCFTVLKVSYTAVL